MNTSDFSSGNGHTPEKGDQPEATGGYIDVDRPNGKTTSDSTTEIVSSVFLVPSYEVIIESYEECVAANYRRLLDDISKYFQLTNMGTYVLDTPAIEKLQYRFRYCSYRADIFIKGLKKYSSHENTEQAAENSNWGRIIQHVTKLSWRMHNKTDKQLEILLRQTSVGMKYFPKTFGIIESIDSDLVGMSPSKATRKKRIDEILSIAKSEQEIAINKLRPRLNKHVHEYTQQVSNIALFVLQSISETGEAQNELVTQAMADTQENHSAEIFGVIDELIVEENELALRLRRTFGSNVQYISFDLDPWEYPELPDTETKNTK